MSRHDFPEWADMFDSAPPCVLPLFKSFQKYGGDPVRWKEDWLKELGMSQFEKTAIEIGVLTRATLLFGTYDQLNCPCLAGMEVLCQRLSRFMDAYAGGDASQRLQIPKNS